MESPFTMFPNIFLERFKKDPYGLIFAFVIYRWTIGFGRTSYKLTNVKISEESGISLSKIGEIRKRACKKAEINATKLPGCYEYEITIFPLSKESITPRGRAVSPGVRSNYPEGKVSRGAIDSFKDNSKENRVFCDLLKIYPKTKATNQHLILQAYGELSTIEEEFLGEALYHQKDRWKMDNVRVKHIPKAEDYLNRRDFMKGKVGDAVRNKRKREEEKINWKKKEKEAEENACSDEEKSEALADYLNKNSRLL